MKNAGGQKRSKMDEMEWMEVFETKKAEVQKLKSEIEKTDNEIDQMVYELYRLTDEEIIIVEESVLQFIENQPDHIQFMYIFNNLLLITQPICTF